MQNNKQLDHLYFLYKNKKDKKMIQQNNSFLQLERNYALLRINQLHKKVQIYNGLDKLRLKKSIAAITDSTSAKSCLDKVSIFSYKLPFEEIEIERKMYLQYDESNQSTKRESLQQKRVSLKQFIISNEERDYDEERSDIMNIINQFTLHSSNNNFFFQEFHQHRVRSHQSKFKNIKDIKILRQQLKQESETHKIFEKNNESYLKVSRMNSNQDIMEENSEQTQVSYSQKDMIQAMISFGIGFCGSLISVLVCIENLDWLV